MRTFDAVVVGAGIAGCAAAREIARAGHSVVLIESGAEIGRPVRCAEYVPKMMARELDTADKGLVHAVSTLRTRLPGGMCHELASPGYVVNKDAMVRGLVGAGVTVRTRTRCTGVDGTTVRVAADDNDETVDARVIIGADGPLSVVGKMIGAPVGRTMPAVQYTCALNEPAGDASEVFFRRAWRAGYAWFFPKKERVNVGLGFVGTGRGQRAALEAFVAELAGAGRITGTPGNFIAGLIPVSGIVRTLVRDNVLLAGDAAGLTDAVTGGGNYQALASGRMAGEAAAAFLAGRNSALGRYERNVRKLFGDAVGRSVRRRDVMEADWDNDDLDGLIRRTWVAFKDYYRD